MTDDTLTVPPRSLNSEYADLPVDPPLKPRTLASLRALSKNQHEQNKAQLAEILALREKVVLDEVHAAYKVYDEQGRDYGAQLTALLKEVRGAGFTVQWHVYEDDTRTHPPTLTRVGYGEELNRVRQEARDEAQRARLRLERSYLDVQRKLILASIPSADVMSVLDTMSVDRALTA